MTRLVTGLLLGVLLGWTGPTSAQGDDQVASVDELLRQFRRIPGLEARFTEEKHIALLAAPLSTEGTLHYSRPHEALARHTRKPSPSSVVVRGGVVRFGDARSTRSLSVDDNPVARALVHTFLHVLRGDRDGLYREFVVTFQVLPEEGGWRMILAPKDPQVRRIFRRLRFEGRGPRIERLAITETSGDRTVMRFDQVALDRRYDDGDVARVFSTDDP